MPSHENLRLRITRARTEPDDKGLNAKERDEIEIETITTEKNENFLLYDSQDSDRVIVLGTERNLNLLCSNRRWYGDGTFSVYLKALLNFIL